MNEYRLGCLGIVVVVAVLFFGGMKAGEEGAKNRFCRTACGEHWVVKEWRCVCLAEVRP